MSAAAIAVSWVPAQVGSMLDLISNDCDGVLTTDHAMSSRGLPVVVRAGRALGPAEVGELTVSTYVSTDDEAGRDVHRALTDAELALIAAARSAGYVVRIPEAE